MADVYGVLTLASTSLTASTAKTVMQLSTPSNRRIKILGWGVFFDGSSPTATPGQVRLLRQTTAGTMSSQSPVQLRPVSETIQTSGQVNATAEPSAGNVLVVETVHPETGYEIRYPLGQEIVVGGSGYIGIECNFPATVDVRGYIAFEE